MIDRSWNANFTAGLTFGGCLSIACMVLALVWLIPIGNTSDWRAFALGAIMVPIIIVCVFGGIIILAHFAA